MFMICSIVMALIYASFLLWCFYHWQKVKDTSANELSRNKPAVAIVVPVRNEKENLPTLLLSLFDQDYPKDKYRVIIVDDHSDDGSLTIAETCFRQQSAINYLLLNNPGNSKKDALNYGVMHSDAELIVTTDADTIRDRQWISSIVHAYSVNSSHLVCSPVRLTGAENFFHRIQQAEFLGLNTLSAAGIHGNMPLFCSGANLAFSRSAYSNIQGYEGSRSVSGDDTQLMLKINKRFPGRIIFNKDERAIVSTPVVSNEKDFISQRRRWASKITSSLTGFTILSAIAAWIVHALMLIHFVKLMIRPDVPAFLLFACIKIIPEILLLKSAGKFFREKISTSLLLAAQPFYCLYIVIIGILFPFTFNWKGRKSR